MSPRLSLPGFTRQSMGPLHLLKRCMDARVNAMCSGRRKPDPSAGHNEYMVVER